MKMSILTAVMLAGQPQAAPATESLFCAFDQKSMCGPGAPCAAIDANETIVSIDFAHNRYTRCGSGMSDCKGYEMTMSGDYKGYRTLEMPSRGAFAKLGPKNDISEVVSLASGVIVSFGNCFTQAEIESGNPDPTQHRP